MAGPTTSFQGGGYPGRPYGSFAGKEASTPLPPAPAGDPFIHGGGGGRRRYQPVKTISLEEYFRLTRKKLKKQLREQVEEAIEAEQQPPTPTEARDITRDLLANVLAAPASTAPPAEMAALRASIAALRQDLLAYASKLAQDRRDEDDEDDAISILLQ